MSAAGQPASASQNGLARAVTAIDLWKTLAILLMFADHYGHFFAPDETVWRAIGRACVPIWFFFAGFAKSRGAPLSWLAGGALLTGLDVWSSDELSDASINILFNFALVRLCRPLIEDYVLPSPRRIVALALLLGALEPLAGKAMEYGTEGALLALAGILHRRWLDSAGAKAGDARYWRALRIAIAMFGLIVFAAVENDAYEFKLWELAVMLALLAPIGTALIAFRQGQSCNAPAFLAPLLRFAGRQSLAIYVVHLAALMIYAGMTKGQ